MQKTKKYPSESQNTLLFFISIRYLIVFLIIALNSFSIFLPFLTVKASFLTLSLFYRDAELSDNIITFNSHAIAIVSACVAISAYYLLLILNFATPMHLRKRFATLLYSLPLLFVINVLRIVIFSFIIDFSTYLFTTLHFLLWFLLSSVIVFLIWFSEIKLFNIKEIPGYSDIKFLIKIIKSKVY